MPCYICGQAVDEPRLDPRDMKTVPCGTCEASIQDCLDTYPKLKDEDNDSEDMVAYMEPDLSEFADIVGGFDVGPSSRDY